MNRAQALRLSLLVSIGASPAACGGTVSNSRDDGDGNAGSGDAATGQGGSSGKTPGGPGKMLPPGTGGATSMGTAGAGGAAGDASGSISKKPSCSSPELAGCDANMGGGAGLGGGGSGGAGGDADSTAPASVYPPARATRGSVESGGQRRIFAMAERLRDLRLEHSRAR